MEFWQAPAPRVSCLVVTSWLVLVLDRRWVFQRANGLEFSKRSHPLHRDVIVDCNGHAFKELVEERNVLGGVDPEGPNVDHFEQGVAKATFGHGVVIDGIVGPILFDNGAGFPNGKVTGRNERLVQFDKDRDVLVPGNRVAAPSDTRERVPKPSNGVLDRWVGPKLVPFKPIGGRVKGGIALFSVRQGLERGLFARRFELEQQGWTCDLTHDARLDLGEVGYEEGHAGFVRFG